ncbi:MAG: hypothetical protein RR255_00505 [Bacilli bacterium]
MKTISITSNDLDFIEKIYNDIPVINCKNNVSIDISNWEDDDEDKICGTEKWITFGDMINILQEQDDENELGTVNQSDLMFTCKSFEDGEFILLRHIDYDGRIPCMVKVHKKNDFSIYIPSFEEMFDYMWKEV